MESNEDALIKKGFFYRLFTGSNHMYIVIITMPIVVVVIAGCDLKQIDIMRHGLDFLKQQKQRKEKRFRKFAAVLYVCSCCIFNILFSSTATLLNCTNHATLTFA